MPLEMNPEIRAAWCAALRSEEYQQTIGALRRLPEEASEQTGNARHCCLGVLTDLWIKAGHDEMVPDEMSDGPDACVSVWAYTEGILSQPVIEWAGLDNADPLLGGPHDERRAVLRNDGGASFAEIADLIDGGVTP